jgi:hypothetical protein
MDHGGDIDLSKLRNHVNLGLLFVFFCYGWLLVIMTTLTILPIATLIAFNDYYRVLSIMAHGNFEIWTKSDFFFWRKKIMSS